MGILKMEDALFETDDKGNVLSKTVPMEGLEDHEIKVRPVLSDELKDITNVTGDDLEGLARVFEKYVIEPKITLEQIKVMKPMYLGSIITTILVASGINKSAIKVETTTETKEEVKAE